eukprot:TRINITY_DN24988_c0_g1_i1.p1 TRINITY_DN24988_c0_g1~~TRINITY_DN24988_c0_g1_i1.p1  ORF type:complete len:705 (+),score=304.06 TRINITY_DN24988_c0_g1_i1:73-2187(+)
MSFGEKVVGIDLGTQTTRVSILAPHQRMPEIVRNNFSLEMTPTVVAFDEVKRYIGEEGLSKVTSKPDQAANLLRLLFHPSPAVNLVYKLEEGKYIDTVKGRFRIAHVVAMLLHTVLKYARNQDGEAKPTDMPAKVVITAPKCAPGALPILKVACGILGINDDAVSVVTDGSAAASCYRGSRFEALTKSLDEAKPIVVVDCGHGHTAVTVAKLAKEGVEVLGEGSSATGSLVIDEALLAKLLSDVKTNHKEDFTSKLKPLARLRRESTKAKEVLSTVGEYTMNVEALTDTFDLQYKVKKDDVETYAQPLLDALSKCTEDALAAAGVAVDDVSEVQVIGGGWRTPCVQAHIKTLFKTEELSVHLDPAQTVAQGASLIGARFQPAEDDAKPSEELNGVHVHTHKGTPVESHADPAADAVIAAEELEELKALEASMQEEETQLAKKEAARNELESYLLSLPSIGYDANLPEAESEKLNEYVRSEDDWMMTEECEATPELLAARLTAAKAHIAENFAALNEHVEKRRKEQEEKDRQLAEEAKQRREEKVPKSDPQRLKVAQEKREQGVKQFKQEHYHEAVTRFVQALATLKDIYDLDNPEYLKKRNEIALSCHLNIATSSLKLKKYSHAAKNCTQALDYDKNSAKAYFRRGQARRHLTEHKEARQDLKKALEITGGDAGIEKELKLLEADEAAQKKKDKKLYSKMFGGM